MGIRCHRPDPFVDMVMGREETVLPFPNVSEIQLAGIFKFHPVVKGGESFRSSTGPSLSPYERIVLSAIIRVSGGPSRTIPRGVVLERSAPL